MRIRLSTILPISAERAWEAVLQPRLLEYVAWALQTFERMDPPTWPGRWEPGDYEVRLRLFGVLPMGRQRVGNHNLQGGSDRYGLRNDGSGDLVGDGTTSPASSDLAYIVPLHSRNEVGADLPTSLIWAFAQVFYRHRQRRWRALVAADLAPLSAGANA